MTTRNIPRQSPNTSSVQSAGQSLFNQLLEIGEKLLVADPELYKTAVAHLRDNAPREPSPVRRAAGAEQKGIQSDHNRRQSTGFHKYNLPGDAGKREYYQCMICSERRVTNSFQADHQHDGQKQSIRWYCPLCDTLYAVTHRGYHIKNRHKTPGKRNTSERVKEESAGDEDESQPSPPLNKKRRRSNDNTAVEEDGNTSQCSEEDTKSANLLADFKGRDSSIQPPPPPPPPLSMPVAPSTPQVVDIALTNQSESRLTHTNTQEALFGSSGATSEMLFHMDTSNALTGAITPAQLSSSNKLIFGAVPATISRT